MSHALPRLALTVAVALIGLLPGVQAQYRWQDSQGRVVYSDRPPPPEIPERAIRRLDAPGEPQSPQTTPTSPAPSKQPASKSSASPETADRARQQADLERYCAGLREQLTLLAGGGRLMVLNARGEREYLDDEGIARRSEQARSELAARCERR